MSTPRKGRSTAKRQRAPESVVARRARNNKAKVPSTGFAAPVADSDPMEKDSESNWP